MTDTVTIARELADDADNVCAVAHRVLSALGEPYRDDAALAARVREGLAAAAGRNTTICVTGGPCVWFADVKTTKLRR